MSAYETLLVEVADRVALVRLNRPEVRNAINAQVQASLVTRVAEPDELLAVAREVAGEILAKGPLAVRLGKLVIRSGMDADQRTGQVVERLAQALLYTTDDKREGAEAFLAKRTPAWSGR